MDETANVVERKFNGTATYEIDVPEGTDVKTVKWQAKRHFEAVHGSDPSKVVVEKDNYKRTPERDTYTVMAADYSSGSLQKTKTYEL